jgi:hypothetical protein
VGIYEGRGFTMEITIVWHDTDGRCADYRTVTSPADIDAVIEEIDADLNVKERAIFAEVILPGGETVACWPDSTLQALVR